MHERRFNPSLAHRLDDPERLLWLPPAEIVATLGVRSGDVVADIGAGTGYFTLPLARAVGPRGRVFAVDAQEEMLLLLRQKLEGASLPNIETMQAEADHSTLQDGACTLVFLANIWHEFEDRVAVLRESLRILRPGGRIAILDWRPDVEPVAGPPIAHRIAAEAAEMEIESAGFTPLASTKVGRYSWLVQGAKQS